MTSAGLTILALQATNVRRVKMVEIRPPEPTGLIKVSGRNNQGKSSTLETFEMLLGGKNHHPAKPIRAGEKKATASLVLVRRATDADRPPLIEQHPMTLADLKALTPEERATVPCTSCSGHLEPTAKAFICRHCRRAFRAAPAPRAALPW